jgi:peptidyl-prolyl cis-trans isomerase A (cyclophilin A)
MRFSLLLLAVAAWASVSAGPNQSAAAPPASTDTPVASVRVRLDTTQGPIDLDIDVTHAPATSANFLKYVDAGLYDGGRFHRSVRPDTETRKDYPIQVIQASIDPARQRNGFPAIPLERTSVTGLKHLDGTVSMARSSADSATSDFFICIGDQPELDFGGKRNADGQGFAAFGRVVAGMDAVKAIQRAPVSPGSQNLTPPVAITHAARVR